MGQKVVDSLPEGSVIYKEGLDSWDIGIKDFDTPRQEFKRYLEMRTDGFWESHLY